MLKWQGRQWTTKVIGIAAALMTQIALEFRLLDNLKRTYPLIMVSAIEFGLPLARMVALTRILPLNEVGFVSVLTAFIAFLDMSTDLGIYRFVYSTPKAQFKEALASAHALSAVRGAVLCLLALCAAPFVAAAVSLGDDWTSFAVLAPAILLRSFEHLAPRIAERDFDYWPYLKTVGVGLGFALVALVVGALITHNHWALIASVYAQNLGFVFASRWFGKMPYRLDFRSPLFKAAFRFGYPLMMNGIGLAVSQQADRFVVAGLFNLQTVAVYSVVMLATTMPQNLINRILGSTVLARLYHARSVRPWLDQEVRAASTVFSFVGAAYAGAVILVMDPIISLVFGAKFRVRLFIHAASRDGGIRAVRSLGTFHLDHVERGPDQETGGLQRSCFELSCVHGAVLVSRSFDQCGARGPARGGNLGTRWRLLHGAPHTGRRQVRLHAVDGYRVSVCPLRGA